MKIKLIILASLLWLGSLAQSVPDTETFSLQDVYNAVHYHTGSTTFDLSSCFTNAITPYFDATYIIYPQNSMLRFRNYKPIVVDPSGFTYVRQYAFSATETLTSIEISNDGRYLYLLNAVSSTNTVLRRYELSTPYDITTISVMYQYCSLVNAIPYNGDTKAPSNLHLSKNQKEMRLMYSHYLFEIYMVNENDLSNIAYFNSVDASNYIYSGYALSYDPTETHLITSGDGQGVTGDQTRSYTRSGGILTFTGNYSYRYPKYVGGLEWNSDGSKYFTMEIFNTAKLHSYAVGSISYQPTIKGQNPTQTWDISAYCSPLDGYAIDFCFSDNMQYMYVLSSSLNMNHPVITQFSIQ